MTDTDQRHAEKMRRIQAARRDAGLDVSDRIRLTVDGDAQVVEAVAAHRELVAGEVLATEVQVPAAPAQGAHAATEKVADTVDSHESLSTARDKTAEAAGITRDQATSLFNDEWMPRIQQALAAATAPGGAVSLLVAGRFAAVLSRVVAGRLAEARQVLVDPRGRWGPDDQLRRRMDVEEIRTLVEAGGRLAVERVQGHRVLADLVPDGVPDAGGEALAELEDIAAGTPPLRDMASRIHVLARRPG